MSVLVLSRSSHFLVAVLIIAATFTGCGDVSPQPIKVDPRTIAMSWASYQLNVEPHFRLIFEGGAAGHAPEEVKILDSRGLLVASAEALDSAREVLVLCGGGKSNRPTSFGPRRATISVPSATFRDFIQHSDEYRVMARVGLEWISVEPTHICDATE